MKDENNVQASNNYSQRNDATPATKYLNEQVLSQLQFANREDFEFAERGFIATHPDRYIKKADGTVIWDFTNFDFLKTDNVPATVNPSLWRQAQLLCKHGLFKVTEDIYQVRGFDIANLTVVVGKTGYIIVDTLTSVEAAKAAMDLIYKHLGEKPVFAVILTHTHSDHYGGIGGVVSPEEVQTGKVQVIAPEGFLENVASENVMLGNIMGRRGFYQIGIGLPFGPKDCATSGIGPTPAAGTQSLYAPTMEVKKTGETLTIDGVEIIFQMTPGAEAPVEMNFYFPQFRALCMAENANASLHNILTPRGALVRDSKAWADYLTESIRLFGDRSDVMFATHFWPRFGQETLNTFIAKQRDMYKYLHDQTVRLMNHGYTGAEIAEDFTLPDVVGKEWYNRGYYGSFSFNIKAIYQRYLGWYDGNPANLHSFPPVEAGKRYVEAMGGADAILSQARTAYDQGDYRWAVQLLNHLVFAEPTNQPARNLLSDAYEQLAYQSKNGPWRNMYLTGAGELRRGVPKGIKMNPVGPAVADALTGEMLLDYVAIRLNGPKAIGDSLEFNLFFTDSEEQFLITVKNGVLVYEKKIRSENAPTVSLTRKVMVNLLFRGDKVMDKVSANEIKVRGDITSFSQLFELLDTFEFFVPLVEPKA